MNTYIIYYEDVNMLIPCFDLFFFYNNAAPTDISPFPQPAAFPIWVLLVSCATPLPPAFMPQISSSTPPSRWQSNAIRLPSGDHAANVSILGSFVSRVTPLPSEIGRAHV